MSKNDNIKIFVDEIYSKPSKKNYPTNKTVCNNIDEIWSIDLVDMIDYKISNDKQLRYKIILIYNFSKHL